MGKSKNKKDKETTEKQGEKHTEEKQEEKEKAKKKEEKEKGKKQEEKENVKKQDDKEKVKKPEDQEKPENKEEKEKKEKKEKKKKDSKKDKKDKSSKADKQKDDAESGEQSSKNSTCTDEEYDQLMSLMDRLRDMKATMSDSSQTFGEVSDVIDEMDEAVEGLQNMCGSSQLIWKIPQFQEKYRKASRGIQAVLYSPVFESHQCGYNMALSLVPYGDGKAKGQYMSIFFCLLKGGYDNLQDWPFSHKVSFTLLDQTEDPRQAKHLTSHFVPNPCKENMKFMGKPENARNPSIGLPKFAAHDDMFDLDNEYIRDDTIFIRVRINLDDLMV